MYTNIINFLLLFSLAQIADAEIYKWKDAEGNVHYGDKPVKTSKQMDISEEASNIGKISKDERDERRRKLIETYDMERKEKKEKQEKDRKNQARLDAQCGYAKDRLRRYKKAKSLYNVDKDGNRTALSEKEHKKAIKKLNKDIKKHCS